MHIAIAILMLHSLSLGSGSHSPLLIHIDVVNSSPEEHPKVILLPSTAGSL